MKTLVQAVVDAADTEQYSTIFKNYFQPRHRAAVKQVFTNMYVYIQASLHLLCSIVHISIGQIIPSFRPISTD